MSNPVLSMKNVCKSYGANQILIDLSIDVYKGEFITLLGESGCGKTTTLRCIAGLEEINSGDILLDGQDVKGLPPDKREVNTVFQNYALFPHMNVFDNIAYGPRIRGVSKAQMKDGVGRMLELVKMEGYEKRMPHQLSGGQRQRIAIARALINDPLILLLDEPLGALDQKLRQHMQTELKRIQIQAGVTFIYVTHDQEEAINMSDRIGIMNGGGFIQIGTPQEIYENPRSLFVAEFIGDRNIIPVTVTGQLPNETVVELAGQRLLCKKNEYLSPGDSVNIVVHTDRAVLLPSDNQPPFENVLSCNVVSSGYAGSRTKSVVMLNGGASFSVISYNTGPGSTPLQAGEALLSLNPSDIVLVRR